MSQAVARASDPRLEAAVAGLAATGRAIEIVDADWRLRWVSDDLRYLLGARSDDEAGIGQPFFATRRPGARSSVVSQDAQGAWFRRNLPYILYDLGDRDALRDAAWPEWEAAIAEIEPEEPPLFWSDTMEWTPEGQRSMTLRYLAQRIHAPDGELLGTSYLYGANMRARLLAYVARGSEPMLERMVGLTTPSRQECAILFADLEASDALSRALPSSAYFGLLRELTTELDDVVIEAGGIVGKHAGDGMTAFFLADDAGSCSAAAGAALRVALRMREATASVADDAAELSGGTINPDDIRVNLGVHWGSTLYMGQVVTSGRLEVTALGDEVNECARIQETAHGGVLLASKALVERLTAADGAALGIDPSRTVYRPLSQIGGVSDKAIRTAGSLAVCRIAPQGA